MGGVRCRKGKCREKCKGKERVPPTKREVRLSILISERKSQQSDLKTGSTANDKKAEKTRPVQQKGKLESRSECQTS